MAPVFRLAVEATRNHFPGSPGAMVVIKPRVMAASGWINAKCSRLRTIPEHGGLLPLQSMNTKTREAETCTTRYGAYILFIREIGPHHDRLVTNGTAPPVPPYTKLQVAVTDDQCQLKLNSA